MKVSLSSLAEVYWTVKFVMKLLNELCVVT